MAKLSPLSPEEKQEEYARLKHDDPAFFEQVQALADAVKNDELAASIGPEAIAAISKSPECSIWQPRSTKWAEDSWSLFSVDWTKMSGSGGHS